MKKITVAISINELYPPDKVKVKPTKVRCELFKQLKDKGVQDYIRQIDACTTKREVQKVNGRLYEIIPYLRSNNVPQIGGLDAYWTAHDYASTKERELGKIEKGIKDSAKADRVKKVTEVKDAAKIKLTRQLNLPELKKILDEIGESFHAEIFESSELQYKQKIKQVFTDGKFNMVRPGIRASSSEDRAYRNSREFVLPFMLKDTLRSDWRKIVKKRSTDFADQLVDSFKIKMAQKLGDVIDKKRGAKIKRVGSI